MRQVNDKEALETLRRAGLTEREIHRLERLRRERDGPGTNRSLLPQVCQVAGGDWQTDGSDDLSQAPLFQ